MSSARDELRAQLRGGIPLQEEQGWMDLPQVIPRQLLDAGDHFDDINRASRLLRMQQYVGLELSRDRLHDLVVQDNLQRPPPVHH